MDPPAGSPTGTLLRLDETPPAGTCLPSPSPARERMQGPDNSPQQALMRTTDSVNKSPGPIQRALMKRAYEKFLVHAGRSSPQSPPRAALRVRRPLRGSHRLHGPLYDAGRPGHKDILRTYLRPLRLALTRPVCLEQLSPRVSSIHGLNQKITPSTSGGHAQSQVQSSLAFSTSHACSAHTLLQERRLSSRRSDSHAPRPW